MDNIEEGRFTQSRKLRDEKSKEKDKVLIPLLKELDLSDPKHFHAILMPCWFGPEAYFLVKHNVPAKNLIALERDKEIWQEIRNCQLPERQPLKGMQTTETPCSASRGINWVCTVKPTWKFNLIYLDYLSYMNFECLQETLRKIFRLKMLTKKATLIMTFGKNRTSDNILNFNQDLESMFEHPIETSVACTIKESGYRIPSFLGCQKYKSIGGGNHRLTYQTCVVKWE